MKNKELYKLLKNNKSNSGFTLTELLVGLFMSIFVIGALGFGLMTVLATSQSETSKVKARTENSRALNFVSDEVRRAKTIETNLSNARVTTSTTDLTAFNVTSTNIDSSTGAFNSNTTTNKKIVFALDIPEVSNSGTLGADTNPSTTERIIYFLKSASGTNWKGPAVLYRWGPPLDANGNYTNGNWAEQALIDGIDETHITATSPCGASGGTLTPPRLTGTAPTLTGSALSTAATGFYACVVDTNTAQLFLTGQTKTASGVNDSQTNDSQVVARARERAANQTNIHNSMLWENTPIGGSYGCGSSTNWDMRTDFYYSAPSQSTKWIQDGGNPLSNTQPQPIQIYTAQDLNLTSSAIGKTGCNGIGNDYKKDASGNYLLDGSGNKIRTDGSEALSTYTNKISHRVDFNDPRTFNGDKDGADYNSTTVGRNDEKVQFFKKGYDVPLYGGYDADGNPATTNDIQYSLGRFLYEKKIAILKNPVTDPTTLSTILANPNTQYIIPTASQLAARTDLTAAEKRAIKILGDNQRIVAFEMGQTDPYQRNNDGTIATNLDGTNKKTPGFDLQDNIFIVTSDIFETKFQSGCFSSGNCNPSTGKPNPT